MQETSTAAYKNIVRRSERGAALITMLLVSIPLLMAGGALITITAMSLANNADTSAETKAYYAAEAGAQSVLAVLKGNVAPNPLFAANPTGAIAPENTINFRRAITASISNSAGDTAAPRLSHWLSYNASYTDRVTLPDPVNPSASYSPITGMAFKTTLSDPDNSGVITFSTSGVFPSYGAASHGFIGTECGGSGNGVKVTVSYTAQASTTINSSGASTLGYFTIAPNGSNTCTLPNPTTFNLTITQTSPWPVTYTMSCTLSGSLTSSSSFVTVTFPTANNTNNLQGTIYARSTNPINSNGSTAIPISVTAPEPTRLVAKITGFGPRAAQKQMQMLLSRFAFDFTPVTTITLRSADDGSIGTFAAGSSSQYTYTGFDNAGGQNLPAFGVTSTTDYLSVTPQIVVGQETGSPSALQQVSLSTLPSWLQTADGARTLVNQLRTVAQSTNSYYTTASPPSTFGTQSQPQFTFVDGDAALSPAGGAGLLVVTGTLNLDGSSAFDGLILVLGTGHIVRSGGGNGVTLGSMVVASFGNSGNFTAPTFQSNGSGTSDIKYDSDWVRRALASPGLRVMAIGEF
ncbi:MAG: hypothetical protein DMF76_12450 [Acidobacteria bacterium]|nr:MAG: hypothetical protein DMF76_12450 [Acidobacteriota bacterium]